MHARSVSVYNVAMATNNITVRTLKNGAITENGKIVSMPALSRDTARDMVRARVAKKRAIVQAAALDAVQSQTLLNRYGDEAWIAEVTQAQMQIATTPNAGKSAVMAATWLMDHAGIGERQAEDKSGSDAAGVVVDIIARLAAFVAGEVVAGSDT